VPVRKIENFLSQGAKPDRIKLFEKMSIGKTKQEIRDLEMEMLEPEPLQQHIGEERRYVVNSEFSAKVVFRNQEDMDFFGRFIPITNYIEHSITELKIIFDLFRWMDAGGVSYDKKSGIFTVTDKKIVEVKQDEVQKPVAEKPIEQPSTMRKFFLHRKQT
jgi:hypothetical protein